MTARLTIAACALAAMLAAALVSASASQATLAANGDAPAVPVEPAFYDYRVVKTYPHDTGVFTQGLFFHDGALYETAGRYGESRLLKVDPETGAALRKFSFEDTIFAEGAVLWEDDIIVLSWRSGKGFVFDQETFEREQTFTYPGEGWGVTHDGERLIMSDGTPALRFLDPETLEETGRLTVTFRGRPLNNINELEWIEGEIFANVWQSDAIVRIDPASGAVTGVVDMRGLLDADARRNGADVLNGIAYDPDTERLFVTGKYWPNLYEIELTPKAP